MGIMDEWEKTILPMFSVDVNDLFAQLEKACKWICSSFAEDNFFCGD
jgi:hypothetical protein